MALGGKALLAHAIARLGPQVDILVLNANGDADRFAAFGLPVVADCASARIEEFRTLRACSPAMEWARDASRRRRSVHRSPPPPTRRSFRLDLVARLAEATDGRRWPSRARRAREHYAFGLWPLALAPELRRALDAGRRKAGDFVHEHGALAVDFGPQEIGGTRIDPFFNINAPADLARAEALLQARLGRK